MFDFRPVNTMARLVRLSQAMAT